MMEKQWLTVDQLLTLAAAEGFHAPEVTARKIERWRKERLLPSPRRISLGRGRGTRSEYPPETGPQFLALCRLRRRFPHDLDAIRFGLWYERYPLPIADVKQSMEELLSPIIQMLSRDAPDPLTVAEQLVSQKRSRPRRLSSKRHLKYLRNADEVDAVQIAALQLALGDVPGFTAHAEEVLEERSLAEIFIDALGLKRAQLDRIGDNDPWLPQDMNELARQLEDMAIKQLLSLSRLLQSLKEADAEQLAQARSDMKRMNGLKEAARAMETLLGENAFGFGLFSNIPHDPVFSVLFLLLLLRLRATPLRVGIHEVGAALQNARLHYRRMLALLRALRREHPALAQEILTQTRQLDLSDPDTFNNKLYTIFAEAYTSHTEELQAFFLQHQELVPSEDI